jgi:subtilisin family serine protease
MRKILIFAAVFLMNFQLIAQNRLIKGEKDYYLANTIVLKLKQVPSSDMNGNVALTSQIQKALSPYNISSAVSKFPAKKNLLLKGTQELAKIVTLNYTSGEDPANLSKKISKISGVEWAEPKYARIVTDGPNDPVFTADTTTLYNLYKINAKKAWNINSGNKNIIIAIIDSGVYWEHPDLMQNIHQNLGEDADGDGHTIEWNGTRWVLDPGDLDGIDNDGNGYADDLIGWDFGGTNGTSDNNPAEDAPTHGTLVAGVAGAVTNNGIGIASIGYNCSLMPVKGSREDLGNTYIIYSSEAIKYAADNGAKVINCSFSGYSFSRAEQEVITYAVSKGAVVIAAAGNNDNNIPTYPAGYEGVLSVAATNINDVRYPASSFGETIDVSAPGQKIYTTWSTEGYSTVNGTSLASPLVAGLAGLVKNQFPNYTPLQIGEQIRVTSDDIYNLNPDPTLQHGLGKGRINAYKALTTTNAVSVRAQNVVFNDEGNNNGLIESGEMASISMSFMNYLSPVSNVQVTLSTSSPYVSIQNATFNTGSIPTLDSVTNRNNKFYFKVNENAPDTQKVSFLLTYSAGGYSDYQWISVMVNQNFNTMAANNISLTITSNGNLGYYDFPGNWLGNGFRYAGGKNFLYEGSFMYGTSASRLVDAARFDNQNQNKEFKTVTPFTIKSSSKYADAEGYTVFNDNNASANKLGIETKLIAYQYKTEPYNNFIILRTILTNNSGFDINNLYTGWFLDLDLDDTDYDDDIVAYDAMNKFIYAYDKNADPFKYYTGAALLTSQSQHVFAIDNTANNGGIDISNGFTKAQKWSILSGGVSKTSAGPGDISFLISAGPISINAGSYQNVSYVLAVGQSAGDLKTIIANAKSKYSSIPDDAGEEDVPESYYLSQNYPNPFSYFTRIIYDLPKDDYVKIKVYDILGREIAVLADGVENAGRHYKSFEGKQFASGVYFYQMETSSFRQTKKMVIIK